MPTVIVTGCNRGLGLEFARQYASDGWRVLATARDPAKAGALSAVKGVEVTALDVLDPAAIEDFGRRLAGETIDLLINNAGTMGPPPPAQSLDRLDAEGWVETLRTNSLAPLSLTLALLPALGRAAHPMVATVTSKMGSIADNTSGGYFAYRMSKAAVNMGIKSLALDLRGRRIACLLLHPGWVKTDMGGSSAPVEIPDSVAGMRAVIARAGMAESGRFFDYTGEEIPW